MEANILFRPLSLWIGVHIANCYHLAYKWQVCINIIPCITIRLRIGDMLR